MHRDAVMLTRDDLVACAPPLGHVPPLDRIAPARAAGFAGMSVTLPDLDLLGASGISASEFGGRMRDGGLTPAEMECIVAWLPGHPTAPGAAAFAHLDPPRIIAAAAELGSRSVSVAEMFGVSPSIDEAAESFAAICDLAAERDLVVQIEFLPFGGIPDLATAWRVVEASGRRNGGIMLDSWHLFRSGSTLDELAHIPGGRIFGVQINDAPSRPGDDLRHESLTARLLPGDGAFDLVGLIEVLDRIGCNAPIGVEVFSDALSAVPPAELLRRWANSASRTVDIARMTQDVGR